MVNLAWSAKLNFCGISKLLSFLRTTETPRILLATQRLANGVVSRHFHGCHLLNAPPPKKGTAFKAGMTVTKKKMDVESDPNKLVNYLCGGNYHKEGPEIKLGPDSDYPDWLWTLRTNGPPPLEEMDPNTIEYWLRVRQLRQYETLRILKAAKGRRWLIKKHHIRALLE